MINNKEEIYTIAEIGSNHCCDINVAIKHVEYAAKAKVSAVKFQLLDINKQYLNPSKDLQALHKKADLSENSIQILAKAAEVNNIDFICSGTYLKGLDFIDKLNPRFHKIASAQVPHFPQYLDHVRKKGRPTLASTGISKLADIENLVNIFDGGKSNQLTLMHCRSKYPLDFKDSELSSILFLRNKFKLDVAYSDHTLTNEAAIVSVAYGVNIFEKHFKIDNSIESPDSNVSITTKEMENYILQLKNAKKAIGDSSKYRDLDTMEIALSKAWIVNVISNKDVSKGEFVNIRDLKFLRSKNGISATNFYKLTRNNKVIFSRNLKKGEILKESDITSF